MRGPTLNIDGLEPKGPKMLYHEAKWKGAKGLCWFPVRSTMLRPWKQP